MPPETQEAYMTALAAARRVLHSVRYDWVHGVHIVDSEALVNLDEQIYGERQTVALYTQLTGYRPSTPPPWPRTEETK